MPHEPGSDFESLQRRLAGKEDGGAGIVDALFPRHAPRPLICVQDGHPHALSFLSGVRGDVTRCLGVTEYGQSGSLQDVYKFHGIDTESIVEAAWDAVR